jgi:hypothetical protein
MLSRNPEQERTEHTSTMGKSMIITTTALAVLISTTTGCKGQLGTEPLDGTQATSVAAVPFDLGMSTYLNEAPTPIAYDVDSRFVLTVTKEKLRAAKTIYDIVPAVPLQEILSYSSVSIRIIEDNKQTDIVEIGTSPELNRAQLKLLHSLDYSTNFVIRTEVMEKSGEAGQTSWNYSSPHVTIVPEKEAVNSGGKDALINYAKVNTSGFGHIVEAKKLRPGQINFTVNKEGTIADVRLCVSSGYPDLDQRMIELVNTLPGSWEPATDGSGEKVEQEFVFSFGKVGC